MKESNPQTQNTTHTEKKLPISLATVSQFLVYKYKLKRDDCYNR